MLSVAYPAGPLAGLLPGLAREALRWGGGAEPRVPTGNRRPAV